MTPDERLNQLEPAMADGLQKIDRLIENQGLLVNEVSKIPGIEKNVGIIAKGVVDLTTNVNARFDNVDTRFDDVSTQFNGVNTRFDGVNTRFDDVDTRFDGVNTQFGGVNMRFDGVDTQLYSVNTRFDQVQRDIVDLKAGQELILQILREKLL